MSFSYNFGITDLDGNCWTGYEPYYKLLHKVAYPVKDGMQFAYLGFNPLVIKTDEVFFRFCVVCGRDRMLFPINSHGQRADYIWPFGIKELSPVQCFTCEKIPLPKSLIVPFTKATIQEIDKARVVPLISFFTPQSSLS